MRSDALDFPLPEELVARHPAQARADARLMVVRGATDAPAHHSFRELYQRGQRAVILDVDAQSLTGATRLYEKAGMHVQRQNVVYEKELRPGEELRTESLDDGPF